MSNRIDRIAGDLVRELGPLRRAMLRATRNAEGLPDLPENQIEVLRAATAEPGITTGELAQRLELARPTVSNLVNSMRRQQLIDLRRRDHDARIAEVHLTEYASDLLHRYDAAATKLVSSALNGLDPAAKQALAKAIPAFAALREQLSA